MGQDEIMRILKKEKGNPLSAKEIAKKLNLDDYKKVFVLLKKMIRFEEVSFIEISRNESLKNHNCKHRMKLYFLK
jgi:repressor of nif and glnA expression